MEGFLWKGRLISLALDFTDLQGMDSDATSLNSDYGKQSSSLEVDSFPNGDYTNREGLPLLWAGMLWNKK